MYYNTYLLICLILLAISFLICTALLGIHTYFMLNNTTTWERFSRKNITYLKIINDEKLNPFYENCCRNITHFFQCNFCASSDGDVPTEATSEDENRWERIYLKYIKKQKVISKDVEPTIVPQSPTGTISVVPECKNESKKSSQIIQMDGLENNQN